MNNMHRIDHWHIEDHFLLALQNDMACEQKILQKKYNT